MSSYRVQVSLSLRRLNEAVSGNLGAAKAWDELSDKCDDNS